MNIYTHAHMCICKYIHINVYKHVCNACVYTRINIYINMYVYYVYTRAHMCMCVCLYILNMSAGMLQ